MPTEFDSIPSADADLEWIACARFNAQAERLEQAATLGISAAARQFVYVVQGGEMLVRVGWERQMMAFAIWLMLHQTPPP